MTYEQETLWLAGLLEGEGCFYSANSKYRKNNCMCIQLKMTDEDVVRHAGQIMDVHVGGPFIPICRGVQCKPVWTIQVSGKRAAAIARRILPYMGHRRTLKIEYLLDRADNALSRKEVSKLGVAARKLKKSQRFPSLFAVEDVA